MLPKEHRLTGEENIISVLRTGEVRRFPFLSVHFLQKEPPIRVAVVVGKKASKQAVDRNKVKRRIREAFRAVLPDIRNDVWVVAVATKDSVNIDIEAFKDALVSSLSLN